LGVISFALPAQAQAAAPKPAASASAAIAPKPMATVAPSPQLNDSAELARVVNMYEAGKYIQCADSLRSLLSENSARPLRDPDVVESARIYQAACLIGSGQPELADEPLRAAIRQNPQMKPPDSLVFPPQVIDHFLRVRETMFDVIKKAEDERVRHAQELAKQQEERARRERIRVAGLERLGEQQTSITPHSRYIALVPFGVGQFQNGKEPLGFFFLTSEVLLAATTLTTLGIETHLVSQANDLKASGHEPAQSTNGKLNDWYTAIYASSYAWIGVSLIGVLEAELSFVPEQRTLKKHPLPLELRPLAEAGPGGGVFGVSGRF
jgi:hypothetical protein